MSSLDSLSTLKTLQIDSKTYHYFSLPEAAKSLGDLDKLPMSLKVLLENLLRWEDNKTVTGADLKAIAAWLKERQSDREIQYRPARVLMQDFTGVPAVVDLAAMRAAVAKAGGDPQRINPLSPVDLVIDHSVMVDKFGGIEAEAAMLGQPVSMLIPEVIGFKLTGKLKEGITATDLVLTVTQMLRKKGVVGKFVEFYGDGLADLPLADRATIANMAPEYGATCGFFPVDEVTLDYLRLSGRPAETVKLVEAYTKAQEIGRAHV